MSERIGIYNWAMRYCGDPDGHDARGQAILGFLFQEGMGSSHRVLEIGCGALSLGVPLIRFLESDRYVGIEPNGWLVEAALCEFPDLAEKHPRFLWRSDFDASELGLEFEFAVAHSVLSHAAGWQLPLFLAGARQILCEGGVLLASLVLGECDSNDADWVYPGNAFFSRQTIEAMAEQKGLMIEFRPDLREELVSAAPINVHDWFLARAR